VIAKKRKYNGISGVRKGKIEKDEKRQFYMGGSKGGQKVDRGELKVECW